MSVYFGLSPCETPIFMNFKMTVSCYKRPLVNSYKKLLAELLFFGFNLKVMKTILPFLIFCQSFFVSAADTHYEAAFAEIQLMLKGEKP